MTNHICKACCESTTKSYLHKGHYYCGDCWAELACGVFYPIQPNRPSNRSVPATLDAESPWGENAVRALEDGR